VAAERRSVFCRRLPVSDMKYRFIIVFAAVFLMGMAAFFDMRTFFKIVYHNYSNIEDYKIFPSRPLTTSPTPFYFPENPDDSRIPRHVRINDRLFELDDLLRSTETVAFLVIKDDVLIAEKYFQGYHEKAITTSFSATKSFFSILVGLAIEDGYIESIDQPVTAFVPELAPHGFEKVTIEHLLQMTSGIDYVEDDNPFGIHVRFYYGDNLEKRMLKFRLRHEPGRYHEYKSGDTQLLGLIMARVLSPMTLTQYMQMKIWTPLGMECDGSWSIDNEKDGLEKVFCCLNGCARDYAKFGRLFLQRGQWNGKQIISEDWVEQSTRIDVSDGSVWGYQYHWWLVNEGQGDYMAAGHLGQYVYVNPARNLIIVRLGRSRGKLSSPEWRQFFTVLAEGIL